MLTFISLALHTSTQFYFIFCAVFNFFLDISFS